MLAGNPKVPARGGRCRASIGNLHPIGMGFAADLLPTGVDAGGSSGYSPTPGFSPILRGSPGYTFRAKVRFVSSLDHHSRDAKHPCRCLGWMAVSVLLVGVAGAGCSATKMAEFARCPRALFGRSARPNRNGEPQPSDRTMQFLRVYDLTESLAGKPEMLLEKVHGMERARSRRPTRYTFCPS